MVHWRGNNAKASNMVMTVTRRQSDKYESWGINEVRKQLHYGNTMFIVPYIRTKKLTTRGVTTMTNSNGLSGRNSA